jgi:hypothetical protein
MVLEGMVRVTIQGVWTLPVSVLSRIFDLYFGNSCSQGFCRLGAASVFRSRLFSGNRADTTAFGAFLLCLSIAVESCEVFWGEALLSR